MMMALLVPLQAVFYISLSIYISVNLFRFKTFVRIVGKIRIQMRKGHDAKRRRSVLANNVFFLFKWVLLGFHFYYRTPRMSWVVLPCWTSIENSILNMDIINRLHVRDDALWYHPSDRFRVDFYYVLSVIILNLNV